MTPTTAVLWILWFCTFANSTCQQYVIISTRGTNEPQGPSIAFGGMINSTIFSVPGGKVYETVYPASSEKDSLQIGANDLVRFIDTGLQNCPAQKYVLLGYSQGASVTAVALHNYTVQNSRGYRAIEAVVVVGDPAQRANQSAVFDQFNGTSTRSFQGVLFNEDGALPQVWYDSGKLRGICYTNDVVCVGNQPEALKDNFRSHLRYGNTSSVQAIGAQFLIDKLSSSLAVPQLNVHPLAVDGTRFPSTKTFRQIMSVVGTLGLRIPASPRQNILIDWILDQLRQISGLDISSEESPIKTWETLDDKSLLQSARLSLNFNDGHTVSVPIIGAIPWTRPTSGIPIESEMIYVPPDVNLTSVNVTQKIVLRDFGPTTSYPYPLVFFPGLYRSPDTDALLNASYDRPFTGAPGRDLIDASLAGATGYISMFGVPRDLLESYFDPHDGVHYELPGIYVGSDEAKMLKSVSPGTIAVITLDAIVTNRTQRQITARLPGRTNDSIYIICHTDGNTYVQDSGISALLTLAEYFGSFPRDSRNKTLVFTFTTGHLGYVADSINSLAIQLDQSYDTDTTVLAIALEHMGTREILPELSTSGTANGNQLVLTGHNELMVWCVGPSDTLRNASIAAAKQFDLDRVLITQGASIPDNRYVPEYRSFGGIGSALHQHLIPTISIISGPWSLWAPAFGASAIDYERLRDQTLAFADVIVAVDGLDKDDIAGYYREERNMRKNGTKLAVVDQFPPAMPASV